MINPALKGKIALITGATNGIGKVIATEIARQGAKTVIIGRNKEKTIATQKEIIQLTKNQKVDYFIADLSSQNEIRNLTKNFQKKYNKLHILVNNAGAIFSKRQESVDLIEMTFALNHLAYFQLTNLLLPIIKKSQPARIINTSSGAHKFSDLDFEDINHKNRYHSWKVYGASKLCNLLFTYELAERLKDTKITVNAFHPGWVATGFGKNNGSNKLFHMAENLGAITPEQGAQTGIYLAISPEVENITGKYFYKKQITESSKPSRDKTSGKKLWEISEKIIK